ncbi:hypothetical protein L1887_58795 [Cichorium endivia]|nr:hypothetical protein L1887_58795 [Cichorium endivia]
MLCILSDQFRINQNFEFSGKPCLLSAERRLGRIARSPAGGLNAARMGPHTTLTGVYTVYGRLHAKLQSMCCDISRRRLKEDAAALNLNAIKDDSIVCTNIRLLSLATLLCCPEKIAANQESSTSSEQTLNDNCKFCLVFELSTTYFGEQKSEKRRLKETLFLCGCFRFDRVSAGSFVFLNDSQEEIIIGESDQHSNTSQNLVKQFVTALLFERKSANNKRITSISFDRCPQKSSHLFSSASDREGRHQKIEKAQEDVSKNLVQMKNMLYSNNDQESQTDIAVAQLAQELYNSHLLLTLINNLTRIEFEAKKDVALATNRYQIAHRRIHLYKSEILFALMKGYEKHDIALNCGSMLPRVRPVRGAGQDHDVVRRVLQLFSIRGGRHVRHRLRRFLHLQRSANPPQIAVRRVPKQRVRPILWRVSQPVKLDQLRNQATIVKAARRDSAGSSQLRGHDAIHQQSGQSEADDDHAELQIAQHPLILPDSTWQMQHVELLGTAVN